MRRGFPFSFSMTAKNPSTLAPIDLNGYTFEAGIDRTPTILITVTSPNPSTGVILISCTAENTLAIPNNCSMWYVGWTPLGGARRALIEGKIGE
jgi:hypothetical protein